MKNLFYASLGTLMIILTFVVLLAIYALLFGYLFQLLWNWAIVDVFNAPVVTYWNSVGIVLIINLVGSAFKSTTTPSSS